MKKFRDTIGNRNRDLPVCSAVPQPLRHRVTPLSPQALSNFHDDHANPNFSSSSGILRQLRLVSYSSYSWIIRTHLTVITSYQSNSRISSHEIFFLRVLKELPLLAAMASVRNYHSSMRNSPEEHSSVLTHPVYGSSMHGRNIRCVCKALDVGMCVVIPRRNLWMHKYPGVVCISLYLYPFERTRNGDEKEHSKTTILTSFHRRPGRSFSS
jgi:hypothetical protein